MTRINVVPAYELCDQHLLAEHRELTRIPNCIAKGKYDMKGQPSEYKLGTGHVKFFYDKLGFLKERYTELHAECLERGFNVTNIWPAHTFEARFCNSYSPTTDALTENRERILVRMPKNARYAGEALTV